MIVQRGRYRIALITFVLFGFFFLLYALRRRQDLTPWVFGQRPSPTSAPAPAPKPADHDAQSSPPSVELVVASTSKEDTAWLPAYFPEWKQSVYVVDDLHAALTVPLNKGHESMVYLSYIIDNYDNLPDNVLFIHASRFAWHNDDPDYDALPTLRNFQFSHLQSEGYVNLRCVWTIGCPSEIRPHDDAGQMAPEGKEPTAKGVYKQSFQELWPGRPVPDVVAVSCCSQFAVTRDTIRKRPREDYIGFRRWLVDTKLEDSLSGRVFEFSWHSTLSLACTTRPPLVWNCSGDHRSNATLVIFGKEAVHCPSARDCYCKVFGLCDMQCSDSTCDGRYVLPKFSTLPQGWPRVDWDGKPREFKGSPN